MDHELGFIGDNGQNWEASVNFSSNFVHLLCTKCDLIFGSWISLHRYYEAHLNLIHTIYYKLLD